MKNSYFGCLAACLTLTMGLTGCATAPQGVQIVEVPIPIACKATVPARPAMPTRNVQFQPESTFMHRFTTAAMAEIELRQGYEQRLVVELESCLQVKPESEKPR